MAKSGEASPRPKPKPDPGLVGEYVIEPGGQDEPPIGAEKRDETVRWDLVLTVFLRLVALIWLLKGIGFWMLILGLGDLPLPEERRLKQALIVGFAILNCAASVGIWLLTPWGKSLWLFLAIAEIALGFSAFGGLFGFTGAITSILMIGLFFAIAIAARRARR